MAATNHLMDKYAPIIMRQHNNALSIILRVY
nr:MAG TPA_asm: hypothetical protein [Caudoviricetes sp.]